MGFWNAIPIIGKVVDGIIGLVDEAVEDKDEANKIKAALNQIMLNSDLTKFSEQLKAQMNVVVAEAQGESWLQRNWRPCLMCLFGLIIANNFILYPYLSLFWNAAPMLPIPTEMWGLLKLGVGGYVVGRSVEKGVTVWKGGKTNE